jgi:alginate O-acetyltransferase complex protein AlgI
MITMLLGGFWHGAGWTFIIWGGMHGVFLLINHGWRMIADKICARNRGNSLIGNFFGRLVTFIAVVIAWIMFRAETLDGAKGMYLGMFGFNGISLPSWIQSKIGGLGETLKILGVNFNLGMFHNGVFVPARNGILLLLSMLLIIWFSPNTLEWLRHEKPALGLDKLTSKENNKLRWRFNIVFAMLLALISVVCIVSLSSPSEFLYFQF